MDNSLSNSVVTGLDLNEEPRELLPSYQVLIEQLESMQSRIHERIRQLGEVIERARVLGQQARSSHDLMYPAHPSFGGNSHDFLESRNVGNEGGESSRVGDVDVKERNNGIGRKYKRTSKLVARALATHPDTKKVDKDCKNFYDCNVCLEMAEDPILTCCGHLFCWACFYALPPQDSTSKECPVCMGEVSDYSIIPIYGNGNHCDALKTESTFEVPPRPKAQRIESSRQMRITHGLSVPVSEAIRHIRIFLGATGGHLPETHTPENSNYNAAAQNAQIPLTTDGHNHQSHQGLRVSSENSSTLSDISTALTDAEGIVDEIETYIGALPRQTRTSVSHRYHDPLFDNNALVQAGNQSLNSTDTVPSWITSDVVGAAVQQRNLTNETSSVSNRLVQQSSSSTRRSQRLLDADQSSSHRSSRRRLY